MLAACLLSGLVRAIDVESWAFFIPGGLIGRAERAFGPRVGSIATAAMLTERLLLVVLACVLCGQYTVAFAAGWISQWSVTARLTVQELVMVGAIVFIGLLWTRARQRPAAVQHRCKRNLGGRSHDPRVDYRWDHRRLPPRYSRPDRAANRVLSGSLLQQGLQLLVALALVLPMLGGGGALGQAAREFAPPRLYAVRRTAFFVVFFIFVMAVVSSFLFVAIVPNDGNTLWAAIPLSALAQNLPIGAWATGLLTAFVLAAAWLICRRPRMPRSRTLNSYCDAFPHRARYQAATPVRSTWRPRPPC